MKDVSDAIWICLEKADLCDAAVMFRVMKVHRLGQDPSLLLVQKKRISNVFKWKLTAENRELA